MSSRLEQASQIFLEICDLGPPAQSERLKSLDALDPELCSEVESLLEGDRAADTALDMPAYQAFALDMAEQSTDHMPERIGHYRVVRKLGEGGMGIVFEAVQEAPRRRVAVKLMRPMFGVGELQKRFEYEAAVLGQLQHPGIAQIFEAGTCDIGIGRQPYYAMEYVEGERLGRYAKTQALDHRQRLELLVKVCEAAHHAHQKGIIHRDLKPENILVTRDGQPKILDFGIARAIAEDAENGGVHTHSGQIVGTLAYMSPEQVRGRPDELAISSDVYSLGVISYELLSGKVPHQVRGKPITESARIISEVEPPRLGAMDKSLRGDIETVVAKALEKDKSQRYQSAAEFGADIGRCLDHQPILARPHTVFYELRKFTRRNKALVGAACVTLAAILIGAGAALTFAVQAAKQEHKALLSSYSLGVHAASDALDGGKHQAARTFLKNGPEHFRGWEWQHVNSRLQPWTRELEADANLVGDICYSADGRQLISALADGTIAVWDPQSGELHRPYAADAKITTIAHNHSPGRPRLAAGAEDGRVFIWEMSGGGEPKVLHGHERSVQSLVWSPAGELLSSDETSCRWWRGEKSEKSTRIAGGGRDLSVAPDGSSIVRHRRSLVTVTNLQTLETARYHTSSSVKCISFSVDGKYVVVGTSFQNLHLLDPATLERLDKDTGHARTTEQIRCSLDGVLWASTSGGGTLTLRDAETQVVLGVYSRGLGMRSLAIRPDGQQIACVDSRGDKVSLWDLPLGAATVFSGHDSSVHNLGWSADGSMVYSGTTRRTCRVLDSLTGAELVLYKRRLPHAFGADSERVLLLRPQQPHFVSLDLASGEEEPLAASYAEAYVTFRKKYGIQQGNAWRGTVVSPDGKRSLIRGAGLRTNTEARVLSFPSGEILFAQPIHSGNHWGGQFSPDGKRIAMAAYARRVLILDADSYEELGELPDVHTAAVMSIDFSPDGKRIVTGCHDNMVRVFDAETFEFRLELEGHLSHVAAVLFSPDGTRIASASGDGTVRVWDTLPRHVRDRQARRAAALRKEVAPLVDAWFAELGDRAAVARRLRAAKNMSREQRAAALKVLLLRSKQR